MALSGRPQRRVQVRVSTVRTASRRPASAGLCVVGVCPPRWPWLSQRYPHARVTDTRFATESAAVEHLRFTPGQEVDGLPGLSPRAPSRVRDAVRLALAAGAPSVDVVLARAGSLLPWDLDDPEVAGLLDPFLNQLPEAVLVYPDAGGPCPVTPPTRRAEGATWARLERMIRVHRAGWRARYQVALLDCAEGDDDIVRALAEPIVGDAALCRFVGSAPRLARHGWRSAAAAVGALVLTPGATVMAGISGRAIDLGPGRSVRSDRRAELGFARSSPAPVPHDGSPFVDLALDDDLDRAVVLREPTLREPMGDWSLPALRTVKSIHHRIVQAAEAFVFRPVDVAQGLALVLSLQETLRPFTAAGILLGPDGVGPPRITGDIDKSPHTPGLLADVTAQVRPWCRGVNVRVAVRATGPSLEVSA
jgi:hypothetical protein